MRRSFFGVAASFAVLFLCGAAEARGHRHSAYRHINSRRHVSYYHGHGGGRHHHHADISPALTDTPAPTDMPIVRSHKYLYRHRCGDHYCYKYPSSHLGSRGGGYVADVPAENIQRLAFAFGAAASVRSEACSETEGAVRTLFDFALTNNPANAVSPLGESVREPFQQGFRISPAEHTSCREARLRHAEAIVRFLSAFYVEEGHPEHIYASRLGAARYERLCASKANREEGERISAEMLPRVEITPDELSAVDAKTSKDYASAGEIGCVFAARLARW